MLKGAEATGAWLKDLKANAKIYTGNGAILRAVNAGGIDKIADDLRVQQLQPDPAGQQHRQQRDPGPLRLEIDTE